MRRVTITLDDELMRELGRFAEAHGYQNRSEAVRDLVRSGLRETTQEAGDRRQCVAALAYVYDHRVRQLSRRLTQAFHHHHELSLASMHVHLDERSCLEVSVLKGRSDAVRHFAERIIAERGVRHGRLFPLPAASTGARARPDPAASRRA